MLCILVHEDFYHVKICPPNHCLLSTMLPEIDAYSLSCSTRYPEIDDRPVPQITPLRALPLREQQKHHEGPTSFAILFPRCSIRRTVWQGSRPYGRRLHVRSAHGRTYNQSAISLPFLNHLFLNHLSCHYMTSQLPQPRGRSARSRGQAQAVNQAPPPALPPFQPLPYAGPQAIPGPADSFHSIQPSQPSLFLSPTYATQSHASHGQSEVPTQPDPSTTSTYPPEAWQQHSLPVPGPQNSTMLVPAQISAEQRLREAADMIRVRIAS